MRTWRGPQSGSDTFIRAVSIACITALCLPPFFLAPAPAAASGPEETRVELEKMVLDLTNRERAARRLPRLRPHQGAVMAARQHSEEMRDLKYMSHESPLPAYRTLPMRLAIAGVSENTSGENLGFYASNRMGETARDFMRTIFRNLMKSPHHKANILGPQFTAAGMGIALGEAPAEREPGVMLPAIWLTQVFIGSYLVLDPPQCAITPHGMEVTFSGKAPGKRIWICEHRQGRDTQREVRFAKGRFTARVLAPFSDGRRRVDLCLPGKGRSLIVSDSFTVDPAEMPEHAVLPTPGE